MADHTPGPWEAHSRPDGRQVAETVALPPARGAGN